MLQVSITRGLNAEMDAHLGYEPGDREGKAAAGTFLQTMVPKELSKDKCAVRVDLMA